MNHEGATTTAQPVPGPRAAGRPRAAQPGRDAGPRRRPVREQHHRQPGGPDRDALSRQPGRARHRCQPDAAEQRGSALATGPLEQRRGPRHRRGRQQQRRQPLDPGGPARRLQGVGRQVRPRLQRLDVVRARRHPLRLDDRLQPRPELPRPVQHQRLGGLRQQVHRRRIHLERADDDHQRPEPGRGPQRRPGAGLQRQGHGDRRPDPARLRVRRLGPDRRGPGDQRLHGPGLFLHDDRRRPDQVDARGDLHAAGRRRPWTTRSSSCPTARWWTCSARGRSPAGRST